MKIAILPARPLVKAPPQVAQDVPANVPVRAQVHQRQAVVRDAAVRAAAHRRVAEAAVQVAEPLALPDANIRRERYVLIAARLVLPVAVMVAEALAVSVAWAFVETRAEAHAVTVAVQHVVWERTCNLWKHQKSG